MPFFIVLTVFITRNAINIWRRERSESFFLGWHFNVCSSSISVYSLLPVAAKSRRQRVPSFSRRIASFRTISSTSHLAPLPVSVYKRSPGDSGQRCLVGLARRAHQVIWDWPLPCVVLLISPPPPLLLLPPPLPFIIVSLLKYVARSSGEFQVSKRRGGTSSDRTLK